MIERNRRAMRIGTLLAAALLLVVSGSRASADEPAPAAAGPTTSADWPQYRGPTRDGIAPAGPKLLDRWPKDGPPLIWKSAPLWPDKAGKAGCASVSVADGKAITFAYVRRKVGKIVFTAKDLVELGWMEGVPADLAAKVEDARINPSSPGWKKKGAEQAAYIKEFIAALDPEQGRKFGPWIERRLTWTGHPVNNGTISWATLTKLAAIGDKEFATLEELDRGMGGGLFGWSNPIRSFITDKVYGIFDTVICLDAATGKELWRKEFPGAPVHLTLDVGASSTPTISDGKCYVAGSGGFYCLNVAEGSVVWQAKTQFSHSSPLVMNGVVYCLVPEAAAYDAETGRLLWRQPGVKSSDSSFTSRTSGGADYLIIAVDGGVFCLDPATGKPLWRAPGGGSQIPVIAGTDTLVMVSGDTRAFKLTPAKAEMLWEAKNTGDARGASPLVYQDHVYLAGACHSGDAVRCIDLKTGAPKWNPHSFCAESSSPVMADGKIIALIEEDEGSLFPVMYRAVPERFEELGRFNPHAGPGASPAIVNGKMYLRLQDCVGCWDLSEHRPYVAGAHVAKDELVFDFKQAEGGLTANGEIAGLVVTDASGKAGLAKAHVNGDSLAVDIKDAVFPIKVAYTDSGNLGAKNGPVAPFAWQSPRLIFDHCDTTTLVMKFDRYADRDDWKSATGYAVAGAKITGVEVDPSRESLRLTTDKAWKPGEKTTVRYPAFFPSPGVVGRAAESAFTVTPGQPVAEVALDEYLVGEFREKVDPNTIFDHDDLDKNTRPVVGEKWRLIQELDGKNWRLQDIGKLHDWLRGREKPLVHACVYVHSETDCKVQLNVFAYGGVQVRVNGTPVYTEPKAWQKKEIKNVELTRGWNTLLMGLTEINDWCGLTVVIRNAQGDGVPEGLRYTTDLPREQ